MSDSNKKDHPQLRTYHFLALLISFICVVTFYLEITDFNSSSVSKYNGPWADLIGLVFLIGLTVVLLIHSFVVSLVYLARVKHQGYWGLVVNLIFIFILLLPFIKMHIKKTAIDPSASYDDQISNTCKYHDKKQILDLINNMPQKELEFKDEHIKNCVYDAVRFERVNILNALEQANIVVIPENNEERWRALINQVAASRDIHQQDYDLLVWLADRGKKFNYRLLPSIDFFSADNICLTNLTLPVVQQFADLLISMGGDINAEKENSDPAVWYCAKINQFDNLKFLISRGAKLNAGGGFDTSPLVEAINNYNPDMVNLLIQAGAKPQHNESDDDLEFACANLSDQKNNVSARLIVSALKNAGFHFEKNSPYYSPRLRAIDEEANYNTPEAKQCFKDFE